MDSFVAFDIETTGINPQYSKITEIGAVKVVNDEVVDTYTQLINPMVDIPENITELTGITNALVENMPTIEYVLPEFIDFCRGFDILGHNIHFDFSFIKLNAGFLNMSFEKKALDTLKIARVCLSELPSRSLGCLCKHYKVVNQRAHRAYHDASATYQIYSLLKRDYYHLYPQLFVAKPIHWKPKKDSPITERQKKYLFALINKHNIISEMNKDIDAYTKSEASRSIDQIIRKYGK